jgi:RimJ/RimL family protein N-acetyltransferase
MMNIALHPFSRSDFKELISWIRNPEELFIWSATTFTFPLDESQLEGHYQQAQGSNTRIMYTAVDSQTKQHIGHIELTRIDREIRKASIAYVLVDPEQRGHGYGTAMMHGILKECFDRMKMSKVDLFVFEFNPVAIYCYQKLGFETEEIVEDRIKLNQKFVTLYLMGLEYHNWVALNRQPIR